MKLMKWLRDLIAGHILLQLVATPPLAYFIGLVADTKEEAEAVFDALPTLFWPTLAVLVLAVTLYPGFISPIRKCLRERESMKIALLEKTYWDVRFAFEPGAMDELHPDRNSGYPKLFAVAENSTDRFISQWGKSDDQPQQLQDEEGLVSWIVYLRGLRAQAGDKYEG